jgi:stage II sporulation protein AB (anti-sigma F factor)
VTTVTKSLEISMPATPASIREVRAKVAELAAEAGADERVVDEVRLCVGEAVTNAVVHGYASQPGTVDVVAELTGDELTVVVRDEGTGLADFRRDGDIGYGLRIIDRLTGSYELRSAPNVGTQIRMNFPLAAPSFEPA